ncbi:MAG: hypothetical protein F4X36_08805 [Gammaproteobacteria bacterium]|nr:hypothetical protein [Gammaproteobacteria bacterium]
MALGLLLGVDAFAVIDFDAPSSSENTAYTYSKEYLVPSAGVPAGYYPIGDLDMGTDLETRVAIGDARFLAVGGKIWIRYDVGEHLAWRGAAPRLFWRKPDADGSGSFTELVEGGAAAENATTFLHDGFLLYAFDPPADVRPLTPDTVIALDLKQVLATGGLGDGELRVRAFRSGIGAAVGEEAFGLDKSVIVARVAPSLRVVPRPARQQVTAASGFLDFAAGNRVSVGGFEISINAEHRQPDGTPVGTTLAELNVDADRSASSFAGEGGFAFAPADGGWALEQVDSASGRCIGDAAAAEGDPDADPPIEPDPDRARHVVDFGDGDANYAAGPVKGVVAVGAWHLCATVPEDSREIIPDGDYYVTVTLAPLNPTRPFLPVGLKLERVGTIWRDGTAVYLPYLTLAPRYEQELAIVNRHRRQVAYVLHLHPHGGGTAEPPMITGRAAGRGPTTIDLSEIVTLTGTEQASGTLALVSFPDKLDVTTTLRNTLDGSTDTVVLHRGFDDPVTIAREDTVVHIPVVTTSSDYVQRITVLNRHRQPVRYILTIHPEEGGMADPAVVRGRLGASTSTTLRMDAVTQLSGSARASATLEIKALPVRVDVSMTLVNRYDQSTDTVVLHRGRFDR